MRFRDSIFGTASQADQSAAVRRDCGPSRRRRLRQIVQELGSSGGADLRPTQRLEQPARPGGELQRQRPSSLPSRRRQDRPLDAGGCQRAPAGRRSSPIPSPAVGQADRQTRQEGREMVRLIDATPIPLGKLCRLGQMERPHPRHEDARRLRSDRPTVPTFVEITHANVNDVEIGRQVPIEAGAPMSSTRAIATTTGGGRSMRPALLRHPPEDQHAPSRHSAVGPSRKPHGDGFTILDDAEVELASKGNPSCRSRCAASSVRRDKGGNITLVTNDLERTAVEIAALYKTPLADRAAVPLDQAASRDPQVPRQQRQCHPPADPRRHDRLSAAAHRGAPHCITMLPLVCRTRPPVPVHAGDSGDRQAAANQPGQARIRFPPSDESSYG